MTASWGRPPYGGTTKRKRVTLSNTVLDSFTEWSDALESYGERLTAETGDAIPALSALIGTAYVATTVSAVRSALTEEDITEAQAFLDTYPHLVDAVVAQLLDAGWLDIDQCADGCGQPVIVPAFPVCNCLPEGW